MINTKDMITHHQKWNYVMMEQWGKIVMYVRKVHSVHIQTVKSLNVLKVMADFLVFIKRNHFHINCQFDEQIRINFLQQTKLELTQIVGSQNVHPEHLEFIQTVSSHSVLQVTKFL